MIIGIVVYYPSRAKCLKTQGVIAIGMTEKERPFDLLQTAVDSNVLVRIKGDKDLRGVLKAFDIHMNLVLDEAEDVSGETHKKLGRVILRGDTVVFVSPVTEA